MTLRRNMSSSSLSQTKNQHEAESKKCLLVYSLTYSSSLNMEATCSSETPVDFQRTARCCVPERGTLYNNSCENLKFYMLGLVSE
jgi:hypothetical protein